MALLPAFKRLSFSDEWTARVMEALQENIGRVLDVLVADPRNNGRIIEDEGDGLRQGIPLVAGTLKQINHGLDRPLRGWKIIDTTAIAVIWRDATVSNPAPDRFLYLQCSTNTLVKLEVF